MLQGNQWDLCLSLFPPSQLPACIQQQLDDDKQRHANCTHAGISPKRFALWLRDLSHRNYNMWRETKRRGRCGGFITATIWRNMIKVMTRMHSLKVRCAFLIHLLKCYMHYLKGLNDCWPSLQAAILLHYFTELT